MGEIEIDDGSLAAADFELVHDRAGYDIARSQFRQGVVLEHEAAQLGIAQIGAFSRRASESKNRGAFFR